MRRSSVVGWKSSLVNDCVGMDEGAVGCVVLAGLSLPGKRIGVCGPGQSMFCVWLALELGGRGGAHHCAQRAGRGEKGTSFLDPLAYGQTLTPEMSST